VIDRLAAHLLGGHVPHGAEDHSRAGVDALGEGARGAHGLGVQAGVGELGQAEVEQLHHPVAGQEDVLRLEVAVDDAPLVGGGEAVRDLGRQLDRLAHGQGAPLQTRPQRLALQKLGDEEGLALVGPDVVDDEDVGVGELAGRSGFLLESPETVGIGGHLRG
jgi:hypothetical protein